VQTGASDITEEVAPPGPAVVEVDGQPFRVHLGLPGSPLEVEASTGERVRLRPWRLDQHLRALERHVDASEQGLDFDHQGFAREVLQSSEVPAALFEELAPLALWWAESSAPVEPSSNGWVRAGPVQARLRPWALGERAKAVSASLTTRADGSREFSLERYLREMITASVAELDPASAQDLDGGGATLLNAVVALNTAGGREEDRTVASGDEGGRALAETTLRLCRALGWTPSQVWSTPAAEVDRLLALLDVTQAPAQAPARPRAPRRSSLASHPDAVVIRVEDD
jgi:hypothetical protein